MEKVILSRSQFEALYDVYEARVVPLVGKTTGEKLVHTLHLQIWLKMRKLNVECLPKYRLKLTPAEAQAFLIFWLRHNLPPASFTGNLINTITAALHPKYF